MVKFFAVIMSVLISVLSPLGLVFSAPEDETIENVIIMIGDGMGWNHLYSTEKVHGVELDMLTRTEHHGFSKTRSASDKVTDSAAGGTALATGSRTQNGYVGVYMLDPYEVIGTPASITEVALTRYMSTGVVTSDLVTGATPSAFSAHERDRDFADELFADQLASDIDLIWGSVDAETVTEEACTASGKEYVSTLSDVQALENGVESIGQFDCDTLWKGLDNGDNPTLSELTVEAIKILDRNENGFFLMVEGAHVDKCSHNKDGEGAMTAVLEFDKAVSKAIDFAEADGNTLVIVTADHETGGVTLNDEGVYEWTCGDHTDANVPLLVYGSDDFIEDGEVIKNVDVARRATAFMTNNEVMMPASYFSIFGKRPKK